MIYSQKTKVPALLCDKYENVTLRNLVGMMAEVSINQSIEVEKDLDTRNLRWILYSWDVEIIEPIRAYDDIEISTMAIKMKKFYAYRNCYIKRAGKIVAKAYGVFLLIDTKRMRPVKVDPAMAKLYGKNEEIISRKDIKYADEFNHSKEIFIRNSDIDTNFHVNNAVYFDYISDLCDISEDDVSYINIVYKNEIRDKDSVIGEYNKSDDSIDFRLVDKDSDLVFSYGKVYLNV